MADDAEAAAHGRRDQSGAGGGADQGEGLELQVEMARVGSLVDDQLDPPVLHGRIEVLLDDPAQPVDLVDEDRPAVGLLAQQGDQLGAVGEGRPAGQPDLQIHLRGQDLRQGGLAQPRRTVQQHVVQHLAALPGGLR